MRFSIFLIGPKLASSHVMNNVTDLGKNRSIDDGRDGVRGDISSVTGNVEYGLYGSVWEF